MIPSEIRKILDLAEHYFRSNEYIHAEFLLKKITSVDPQNTRANEFLAYISANQGNETNFLLHLETACTQSDCTAEALYQLGSFHLKNNYPSKAIYYYQKSIEKSKNFFAALYDLGTAHAQLENFEEALNYYQKSLKLNTSLPELYFNIAVVCQCLGLYDESIFHYERCLQLKPDHVDALFNKASALLKLKQFSEALTHYDQAIEFEPNSAPLWSNKGLTLYELRRFDEALIHFDRAIEFQPILTDAWSNKGLTLHELRRFDEALIHFDRAIEINPHCFEALWNKSNTELTLEHFDIGWSLYEHRWNIKEASEYRHKHSRTPNDKNELLNSKILVWHEQGHGETIQFSRFIPALLNLNTTVMFEVQPSLVSLFENQFNCQVITNIKKEYCFDFQIPLLALPQLFKTNNQNIPSVPDIRVATEKIKFWKNILKLSTKKFNIGIAVSGNPDQKNNPHRSIPLEKIKPLLSKGNFFLIQKDLSASDKIFLNNHPQINHVGNQIYDFLDTAAIIENMDLIISIDTSLIHLAGTLNKKSFLMLRWCPDWRWLLNRTDSPWYPSINIFRQKSLGDWDSVINDIDSQLDKLIAPNHY